MLLTRILQVFTIIWDSQSNGPLMLEIHRQTCLLPLSYSSTIMGSMQMYRNWLVVWFEPHFILILHKNSQKNRIFNDQLQSYWQVLSSLKSSSVLSSNLYAICPWYSPLNRLLIKWTATIHYARRYCQFTISLLLNYVANFQGKLG